MLMLIGKTDGVTWDHVRMLVHECRSNRIMAKAVSQGVVTEFVMGIRRKAVVTDAGKVEFVGEGKPVSLVSPERFIPKELERAFLDKAKELAGPIFAEIRKRPVPASMMEKMVACLKRGWRVTVRTIGGVEK